MKLTYSDDSASDYENCKGIICMFNDPKESFSANLISLWRIFIGGKKSIQLLSVLIGLSKSVKLEM